MSLFGGIIGGFVGFTFLGPIGALVGSVVGSRMSEDRSKRRHPNNLDHQVAFFAALFACLAKIAKADGIVSKEEVAKIEEFISVKFNLEKDQRNFAINCFQQAKDDNISFDEYANQLYLLLKQSPNSLLIFYELLFELAMADGELHPSEEKILKRVPSIFKLSQSVFEELYDKYVSYIKNYYQVLGANENMDFSEIRKLYLKKRKEFHPDMLISKGLPEELIEKAKNKFIEIQEAYEELEKKYEK
ncbi:TerB family tellurite resistance protein [SAR86 cluster bacterium]|nr:TerB family tellurite resistance protein [SAR86 cluster bacterium]